MLVQTFKITEREKQMTERKYMTFVIYHGKESNKTSIRRLSKYFILLIDEQFVCQPCDERLVLYPAFT